MIMLLEKRQKQEKYMVVKGLKFENFELVHLQWLVY